MSTILPKSSLTQIEYPTRDGKPMAETPLHRRIMTDAIEILDFWFLGDPDVYVSGNMIVCYVEGDPRKHLAPDVFVVRGVPKDKPRDNYLIWKEGKAPQGVLEVTSSSTRREDLQKKLRIYRDVWKVQEYFLFDPRSDYLQPPLQGHHLRGKRFVRIRPVAGRLPSVVLGLHLEQQGQVLRFYDPKSGEWLRTAREKNAEAEAARRQAEAEVERLRRELDDLRKKLSK